MARTERLEPGFIHFRRAVEGGDDGLATPIRIDVGRKYQFGVIHREAALADAFDCAATMIMPAGRPETGDTALRHILHVLVLALQDQRDLGVKAARWSRRRTAIFGAL